MKTYPARDYPVRGVRRDPEGTEVRMLLKRTPLSGARVVEIGCGDGRLTRRLARVVRSVVGIDPDPAQIDVARRLTPPHFKEKMRFEVGSGASLRFADQSAPVVLLSWSL